jgi:hypothetical protein
VNRILVKICSECAQTTFLHFNFWINSRSLGRHDRDNGISFFCLLRSRLYFSFQKKIAICKRNNKTLKLKYFAHLKGWNIFSSKLSSLLFFNLDNSFKTHFLNTFIKWDTQINTYQGQNRFDFFKGVLLIFEIVLVLKFC